MTQQVFSPVNIEERKKAGIRPGDTVRVWQKIKEKDKTRLQAFEGLVIATKHGTEAGATFTVRKTTSGVGVEKIFPLYSPNIDRVEITKRARARRAKLYYIREKAAREIRKKMRQIRFPEAQQVISQQKEEAPEGEVSEEKGTQDSPSVETPEDATVKEEEVVSEKEIPEESEKKEK